MSTDRSTAIIFTPGKVRAGAIDPNAIPSPEPVDTPRHALAWTTDINMRPVDHDTIQWDAGSVEFSDGVTQAVANGSSPRTLSPALNNGEWYVYKRFSSSALQFTQGFSTAIGTDRIFMGIVVVSADAATSATVIFRGGGGIHISAQSISVGTLSALTANLGEVTAGTLTGLLIRSSESGQRIQLTSSENIIEAFDATSLVGQLGIFADLMDGTHPDLFYLLSKGAARDLGLGSDRDVSIFTNTLEGDDRFQGALRVFARFVELALDPGGHLNLTDGNLIRVGNIDLDSLTKDGAGHIDVLDDVDFNNNRIINAVFETVESDDPTASLSASSTSITAGSSVVLFWSSTNGVSASINQGVGAVAPVAGGTVSVTPASTRTYTLTVVGAEGTNDATASVTITVIPAESNPPTVDSFTATPDEITEGDSLVLAWTTTGATSVSIPGVGSNLASDGSATVSPTSSRSYTITATNDDGSDSETVSVTVNPAAALPVINSFSVSPSSISSGDSVTLAWNTSGATSVEIQYRSGIFGVQDTLSGLSGSGTRTHTPVTAFSPFYRLSATNDAGTVTRTVNISFS